METFWNQRYRQEAFAYGKAPNQYFKENIQKLNPGKILFPAEGEGRNAVYAAQLGWDVYAFDISEEGKTKAKKWARENKVSINYQVGQLPDLNFGNGTFDAIALVFAHFPPNIKAEYHQLLDKKLKKGGMVIFEAFSKNNLDYRKKNPDIGGPLDKDLLFSTEELESYFKNYEVLELVEKEVDLNEGLYHKGKGSVIRFLGRKK